MILVTLDIVSSEQLQYIVPTVRMLRVCRIFKLFVQGNKLVIIYRTLADTLPTLGAFSVLLLLLIYMFTVLSV